MVSEIEKLSVLDMHELVKLFEKKFDVSAVVAAAPADGASEGGGDDGGLVTVTLDDAGANKIQVIKVVKELTGLGLKEAKDFVESAPKPVKEGIQKEEADEIVSKLEEAGAKASVA
ncbi:MAG: 50S ribosomal protein L7/L12 [Candidatus Kaiserbacteria bacterium]|nr:50S ribosomal protein L7/L12 [Candidatus Kaiserbacteria bacterium]